MRRYHNTDLDLWSVEDLHPLADAFEALGFCALTVDRHEGAWFATLESGDSFDSAEPTIRSLLAGIEALEPAMRAAFDACSRRELDIGYEAGKKPWVDGGLAPETLRRMADAGVSLRITVYPRKKRPRKRR